MAREAGALKVLFVSCSPEVTHPHVVSIAPASFLLPGIASERSLTALL
jgi:glutamine phosphoribosylpyrophosphate amidotransferase